MGDVTDRLAETLHNLTLGCTNEVDCSPAAHLTDATILEASTKAEIILGFLDSPEARAALIKELGPIKAEIEQAAVERVLVRMKQLGILTDKIHNPKATARALLNTPATPEGGDHA